MSALTFDLVRRMPLRPSEQRTTFVVLTGTAGPSGEVTITVGTVPRRAVLVAAGLPEGSITHPDATKQGLIAVDERTELTVGGVTAILRQNRRSIGKKGRGISIRLGERDYTYLSVAPCEEELRDSERGALVRQNSPLGSSKAGFTVQAVADATDLALALLLQGADRTCLTITQAAVSGVLSFLQSGKGDV
ncbi:hypothetical protein ACFVW5_08410 [Streptomyces sp. NPDC058232]|uniref:hypothetical protein n=1 Tax=unclassified Streptomyces TaxID=2593676 RepID=UPI0028C397C4|nr:hypothetical protein [Streptomyces sp. AM2-3-1]WNO68918.1 hypothetical protein RPQ02_36445 [Streptomyces sp. AM2-3-1]